MNRSTRIAYLDCFSGVSGDMLLGSLISSGLPVEQLERELAGLHFKPFDFIVSEKKVQMLSAVAVKIVPREKQHFRNLNDIVAILEQSSLNPLIVKRSLAVFRRLAEAEAAVHGMPVGQVHFHEVGAFDTIIDVVGTICGLQLLGISEIHCSPLPVGRGFVRCAHGMVPLPAPAVCQLLAGIPIYGIDGEKELVTPTGAALVAELVDHFGNLPPMVIDSTGYGAGHHQGTEDRPNLLRLITGKTETVTEAQQVLVIETNLDDWNPETFPFLCTRLFNSHAL
ncbi:MAG: TIGR00299 family protein, partial [Proteobacteria bacterium]